MLGVNRVNFKPKRKTVAENFLSLKVCLKKLKFTRRVKYFTLHVNRALTLCLCV